MTEQQIKEALSSGFIETIASRMGYKCLSRKLDHGVDLTFSRTREIFRGGERRFLDSGEYIDFQLKSTTLNSVIFEAANLKYDLEAKTYNDLIDRLETSSPLYLVVFVMPIDANTWLDVTNETLLLNGKAYWFKPTQGDAHTNNIESIRIKIPLVNQIELTFFDDCFQEVFG